MYDPATALRAIDTNTTAIMAYFLIVVAAAFAYFVIAFRLAVKQQVYVVPFIGAALFFWHDLTFVLMYDKWFHVYDHWWVKMWWFALVGTVLFELAMIWQVYRYGHRELWPSLSRRTFGWMIVLGTLGIGAMWYLIKSSMGDELFFITFVITAVFSVPLHTVIMSRRQSQAGQSIAMQLATIVMLWFETLAFANVAPFFKTTPFLLFIAAYTLWPLANIWLIRRLPPAPVPSGTTPH